MAEQEVIEGTWEEIALHAKELAASGKRLKLIIPSDESKGEPLSKGVINPEDEIDDKLRRWQEQDGVSLMPDVATQSLFAQWAAEDAVVTPEEKAENDRIYAEIEKNGIPRVQF